MRIRTADADVIGSDDVVTIAIHKGEVIDPWILHIDTRAIGGTRQDDLDIRAELACKRDDGIAGAIVVLHKEERATFLEVHFGWRGGILEIEPRVHIASVCHPDDGGTSACGKCADEILGGAAVS